MKTKKHRRPFGIMQLFLAMERDLIVGGQAVMEGVMMRTPSAYAIACRKKDGTIVHTAEKLPKWSDKYKWIDTPVLRGGATLIQSMALGIKALNFSAKIYEEDLELEEKAKARELQTEAVLADGTLDDNFRKAPVKITLPEETQRKRKVGQKAFADGGRGRFDNFRARL